MTRTYEERRSIDTDATVRNTIRILRDRGVSRVLVVSQGYHLPRVKRAYRAAGWDVRTVPAPEGVVHITQTSRSVAREIPAFCVYWIRALAGDLVGG